jgi:hypothetical protein
VAGRDLAAVAAAGDAMITVARVRNANRAGNLYLNARVK